MGELLAAHERLAGRVIEIDGEQRAAFAAVEAASAELVALERRAAAGEKVSEATRRKFEDALLQARTTAASPFGERRLAASLAIRDESQAIGRFVADHLDDLLADLESEGQEAARQVDEACEALLAAYAARALVEERVFRLVGFVRPPRPGDIERTRCERLAAEAQAVLNAGGEAAPRVIVRPDQPRHVVAEAVPAA